MKSIKSQITVVILAFIIGLSFIFGVISCYLNYMTVSDVLEDTMIELAESAANHVSSEIKIAKRIAGDTGMVARIANNSSSVVKQNLIDQRVKSYGFQQGNILDTRGKSIFDGLDLSDRDYVQEALNGNTVMSDITVSRITGENSFLIASPIWKGGIPQTDVVGVVYYAVPDDFLNSVVSDINIGKEGYAYIINKDGLNVADIDSEVVGVENSIVEAQSDSSLSDIADIEKEMVVGETGFGKYNYKGQKMVVGYAPVLESDGFSIGIIAPESEFMGNFYISLATTVVTTIAFILIGIFAAVRFGNRIGTPIKQCSDRLQLLAEGDLSSNVPAIKAKDETGILAESTAIIVERLSNVVGEITYTLTRMSEGDLNVEDLPEYAGDFLPLSQTTNKIVGSLNDAMMKINIASEQVSSGSGQVSDAAQSLSQGATEQASSIQELSATISEVYTNIKKNSENAIEANKISNDAKDKLEVGNAEMQRMLSAMSDISESSKKIGNIIKTIDDIAFQTNILALNAAVEAARAGVAGKGFAVVADEVRNLASKSAEAAKNTTDLIEGAIRDVANGTNIADSTAKTLIEVMNESQKSANLVSKIAEASGEQAQAVSQINEGVDQISAVVQTNSATSEESAASSEELSGQANMLKLLVNKFNLKQNDSAFVQEDIDSNEDIEGDNSNSAEENPTDCDLDEVNTDKY